MLGKKHNRTTFNEKINPKNKYFNNPPNFEELANKYSEFKKYVYKNKFGSFSINWKNKEAVKELCKCLLKNDFRLNYWDIPDGFLIPSITSKCNYINWIDDLLDEINIVNKKHINKGLDIGTGANCIYPLLGHQIYGWNFKCSELNQEAIEVAEKIIQNNKLNKNIEIIKQVNEDNIFINIINPDDLFIFTMCNPPYFSKEETKHNNPNTVCEYNDKEVYCKGGEFQFISTMIEESKIYKNKIIWFTTLVGKKINFDKILKVLENIHEIKMIKTTTFYQGKLARWGVAWSYYEKDEKNLELFLHKKEITYSGIRFSHKKNKKKIIITTEI
jgi:23S rRNA (adenine1618-N6)-methyltransferase